MSARVRWWAPTASIWLVFIALGLLNVLGGDVLNGCSFIILAWCYLWARLQARTEFRAGWRNGFAEAVMGHTSTSVPPFALRASVNGGDPTPEPWDALGPASIDGIEVAVHRHGPECEEGHEPPSL